jgi:hypothetical protein
MQQEKISKAEILFQDPKNYSLGMYKASIILDAIRRPFLTKLATVAVFTSVRVDFELPHSRHFLPAPFSLEIVNTPKNYRSVQSLIPIRLLHQY